MTDLHDLLDLATDRVEATGLATGALAAADRRRRDRRAALASAAAVLVVVGGIAVAGQLGDDASEPMPAPSPPPTRTAEPEATAWNPKNVDDLPAGSLPGLPPDLEVPTSSTPALADDPVEAAVLTVGRSDAVKVLGVDGGWRHVYPPVAGGSVQLTHDGTRLLVQTEEGVDLWDVTTGERTSVPQPPDATSQVGWLWLADGTLVAYDDLSGAWEVDATTGEVRRTLDRDHLWDVTNGDAIAAVDLPDAGETLSVTVADRGNGQVRSRLPVRDVQATYANGGLSVQALLDDGTVLLRVLVQARDAASIRFVTWDPATDELSLVMRTSDVLPDWSLAADLLG